MFLLGYDIGSSSVKATILDAEQGYQLASDFYPKTEMPISALQSDWAEQDPEMWWVALKKLTQKLLAKTGINKNKIKAIGIAYQMHGLVLVDKNQKLLRPAIIWCDSRAVNVGNNAFSELGEERCLSQLLNSPGNFTASKLKWVKENEPAIFERIDKMMLPGDYIVMKMTSEVTTTISGLSEGMLWNFQQNKPAQFLIDHYGFDQSILPKIVPSFSNQGELTSAAAKELGLAKGTPICYRAGDQPNNAFSLNILQAGEIAATAGTSGVIYGVSDQIQYDPQSRVNTFAHVNHSEVQNRLGVLLCINGTGILNAWLKKNLNHLSYEEMNAMAAKIPIGSEGVSILPFGNGAERVLNNKNINCQISGILFNRHNNAHLIRAAQEGIVFSLNYGLEIMNEIGIAPKVIRAANANLFLSPIFRETLANITGVPIELYNTDGAEGAARGAGIGIGFYDFNNAFTKLKMIKRIEPDASKKEATKSAYKNWLKQLNFFM